MTSFAQSLYKQGLTLKTGQFQAKVPSYAIALGILFSGGLYLACHFALVRYAAYQSDRFLKKGFGVLAKQAVAPYKDSFVTSQAGCALLLGAYFQARDAQGLAWVSESCLNAGIETAPVYLGLAQSLQLGGFPLEAVTLLKRLAGKFGDTPILYRALAQMAQTQGKPSEAVAAYSSALQRAPQDDQLKMEVLDYLSSIGQWKLARDLAEALKQAETQSAEVKFKIAQVYLKTGDPHTARLLVEQGKALMGNNQNIRLALQAAYPELMDSSLGLPSSQPGGNSVPTVDYFRLQAKGQKAHSKSLLKKATH